MCHTLALLVAMTSCASTTGWAVSDARTCQRRATPRVCVIAEPDHGHVVGLADVELLPGECAVSEGTSGGLLAIATRDRDGGERRRWVSAPRGAFTRVEVGEDGRLTVDRERCDQRPVDL